MQLLRRGLNAAKRKRLGYSGGGPDVYQCVNALHYEATGR